MTFETRIPCRRCERPVRPARTCWFCNIETPAPWADRPDVAAKIVNAAATARARLRSAA